MKTSCLRAIFIKEFLSRYPYNTGRQFPSPPPFLDYSLLSTLDLSALKVAPQTPRVPNESRDWLEQKLDPVSVRNVPMQHMVYTRVMHVTHVITHVEWIAREKARSGQMTSA